MNDPSSGSRSPASAWWTAAPPTGSGLQFFFLGYPMHFDWTKLTDLKVDSRNMRFDFWIGFDF